MAELPWTRISATTLADQVYRVVRVRILGGEIAPGEFIRENDLNKAMGVSRTPIREALGRLASEGFLERLPHRGYRVPEEPIKDLLDLYPVIAALDLLAGKLALPRLTREDVARLRDLNGRLEAAEARKDVRALIELNNQFHRLFSERSGNARLCSLLDDLRAQLTRLERWYYSDGAHVEQSVRQHAEIIEAIEGGDPDRALSLLEANMSLTLRSLLAEAEEGGRRAGGQDG
jgi:DNA-binding GntR family transcriptional regulator